MRELRPQVLEGARGAGGGLEAVAEGAAVGEGAEEGPHPRRRDHAPEAVHVISVGKAGSLPRLVVCAKAA